MDLATGALAQVAVEDGHEVSAVLDTPLSSTQDVRRESAVLTLEAAGATVLPEIERIPLFQPPSGQSAPEAYPGEVAADLVDQGVEAVIVTDSLYGSAITEELLSAGLDPSGVYRDAQLHDLLEPGELPEMGISAEGVTVVGQPTGGPEFEPGGSDLLPDPAP